MKKSKKFFAIIKKEKKILNLFLGLSVILIDSAFRTDKNYYSQVCFRRM